MKNVNDLSLAFVLPRYGASLGGGAEALLRSFVLGFVQGKFPQWTKCPRIEVWTTCAIDHRTWQNHFPEGETKEDGVTIRRFAVDERDIDKFLKHEFALQDGWPLSIDAQWEWLSASVNSKALYRHLAANVQDFDFVIFAPYLFPTSVWGPLLCPDKAVLLPCLHDEKYAYLEIFKYLFSKVRGLIFNAQPEEQLAVQLYSLKSLNEKSAVIGMAFDRVPQNDNDQKNEMEMIRSRLGFDLNKYILYSGRKEQGKNLDLVLNYFDGLACDDAFADLHMLLIGSGEINFRDKLPSRVVDLGFVSESEKSAIMKNALCLVQPSVNESFSIVIMEAWLQGIPVLVHRDCAVTKYHAIQSRGGVYFSDEADFRAVLIRLLKDDELRIALGEQGRKYVEEQYSFQAVGQRLYDFFQMMLGSGNEC